ncbi:MAG: PKD domain-containing protein [Chitinophagales bacterium]|nr:PKD domain-containing protein [Chitinophagales bacterium]
MKTTSSFSAKKNYYAIKILVFFFSIAMLFATSKNAKANCTASFTYTVSGNEVHFTNTSQADTSAYWSWGFGDGTYSDLKNPVHVYNGYGPYVVCLVVNDTFNNCTEYTCDSIYLNNNVGCVADFTYTIDGLTITVTNTSTGTLSAYYWNFGDYTYSSEINTSHEYSEPGYYEVCFSFIDSINNCSDSECKNIYIGDSAIGCSASFTYSVTNYEVHFTNTSDASNSATWEWSFGDGNYSDLENPTHLYNSYGPYAVCLVATDSINNCTATYCDSIYLNNNVGCVADFTYTIDGLTITVTNTSIGTLSAYYWNFGDYTYSSEINTSHEYSEPGYYEVCFSFIDSISGCSDSECKNIYMSDSNFLSCNAAFTYYADGNNIHFVNNSSTCGNDAFYYWTFGDGSYSYNYDPWHLYSSEGTYEVCLTLTDSSCGCVDYSCETITVGGNNYPCNSEFFLVADSTQQGFYWGYNQSTGSNLVYYWWWGDGEYSTDQFPSHTYADSGYYTICLSIYDTITACTDSFCNDYYILKQMKTDQLHQIVFVNTTSVPAVTPQTKYEWSIFPNPASNSISIRTNAEKIDEIKITDASGSVVKQIFSYTGKSISIDELPQGIYLIETIISGMKETKMFVKQ